MTLNINTNLLSSWLLSAASLAGGGFAVFGTSEPAAAKAAISAAVPLMVAIVAWVTHQTEQVKVKAKAAATAPTATVTPAPLNS
ncbi:MAG: hypothetical protein ACRDFB_06375 [Rhabdochlamydiaceae bacterium]